MPSNGGWRSMSLEPRIEISKLPPYADSCRMVAGNPWLGERRRCCVAADYTRSTGKLARPESGLAACPEVESASGQRRWYHAHIPARRHPITGRTRISL
jgi:hypothetical protein